MNEKLEIWRKSIDQLDEKVLNLLAKRLDIVRKIGKFKADKNIPAFDEKRWEQILQTNTKIGEKIGFSQKFIKSLFNLIHKYSLEVQKKLHD